MKRATGARESLACSMLANHRACQIMRGSEALHSHRRRTELFIDQIIPLVVLIKPSDCPTCMCECKCHGKRSDNVTTNLGT